MKIFTVLRSFFLERKKLTLLFGLFILLNSSNLYSQNQYDTLENKVVGPGVTYIKLDVPTVPWKIDILKVEVFNPFIKVETVKSLDKLGAGREKTSAMSLRKNAVGHWSVGAINADFFDLATGTPNNIQVVNGELLRKERPDYPVVGFDSSDHYSISKPAFTSKLILNDTSFTINGINEARGAGQINIYNSYFGNSTGTNNSGSEFILYPINRWHVNDTVYARVDSVRINTGSTVLPSAAMIISAEGAQANYLNANLKKNDTVKILVNVLPGIKKAVEMLGGHPIIVTNGAVAPLNASDPFVTTRHPRTVIGFSADSSIMYLVTVDGRQVLYSRGMDLYELAQLMIDIGAHNAMNFDGGGSTTMVVRNEVVNSPSDPEGERTVANSLLVVSRAPLGPLSKLNLKPQNNRVFIGKTIQFTVEGTDIYYNPITVNPALVQYSVSKPSLGTINTNGLFTAGSQQDSGYVYANYQGIKDSAFVVVKGIGWIEIHPKNASTDLTRILLFKGYVFDTDSIDQQILPQSFYWMVTDTSVGSIDVFGQFQGKKTGTTKVIVSYTSYKDTANVKVEFTTGSMIIDSIESVNEWTITTQNVDSLVTQISSTTFVKTLGDSSMKLDYSFTYVSSEFNWVYLHKDIDIYGVPDSLLIDVYSNGANHRIFFDIEDQGGVQYRVNSHKLANKPNEWEVLRGAFPKSSSVVYPVKLKKLAIPLGSTQVAGQNYSGTIYFDNIRIKFPGTTNIENEGSNIVGEYRLEQNYPNPFNPVTTIIFSIPFHLNPSFLKGETQGGVLVTLKIYDLLGREVAVLINEEKMPGTYEVQFDASKLSSGVYVYRLTTQGFSASRKMSVLK